MIVAGSIVLIVLGLAGIIFAAFRKPAETKKAKVLAALFRYASMLLMAGGIVLMILFFSGRLTPPLG